MKTTPDLMRRNHFKTVAFAMALLGLASVSQAQWVAYNDHVPGSGTSPNTTTYNIKSNEFGFLKDSFSGTNLAARLFIKTNGPGPIYYGLSASTPVLGTPLDTAFHGFVDFGTGTDSTVGITNSTVTYTFTNLPPTKRYSFRGGAVRGLTGVQGTNKWTRVTIIGAVAITAAHSSNVITAARAPADLATNEAAANFAMNNIAATGDVVGWDNIDPGADGSFSIVCAQYQGVVPATGITPNGGHSNGTNAFAITGIRLEQLGTGPPVIAVQPANRSANLGATATFSVTANGSQPLSYQWFRDDSTIPGATASSYTTPATVLADNGSKYSVMIFNSLGSVKSTNAFLTILVQPVQILPLTNVWKYNALGIDLGTDWSATGYDDSGWLSGPGVLAHEDSGNAIVFPLIGTVLQTNNAQLQFVDTFYFRTHIDLSSYDPNGITLTASNLIDDGALVYVNGQEVYRQNMVAAPNPVLYTTFSLASIDATWTSFVIPATALVKGDNLLAVEVHQGAPTSSDIVWGMSIRGDIQLPSPLSITKSPVDRSLSLGAQAQFTAGVSGGAPAIQWYKWVNDVPVPISGATRLNYTITNVVVGDSGYYFMIATNVLGSAVSGSALLTVTADDLGPKLVLADGSLRITNVTVSFSEFLLAASATNLANYHITNTSSGAGLAITKAVLQASGTNVILTTDIRADGINYILTVNNVQDRLTNSIAPNSRIPISSIVTLIGLEQGGWDYYDPVLGPPISPYYPGPNWNQVNFDFGDPSNDQWGHGAAGLFVFDVDNNPLPGNANTSLSQGVTTKYFRYAFNFNPSPGTTLKFRHVVDDGIVAYLNGQEVYRFNMPAGVFNELTPANVTVGVAASSSYIDLPSRLLRSGTNVFAVELHGTAPNDLDWVFGAELLGGVSSFATGPIIIMGGPSDVTVEEGQPLSVTFSAVGSSGYQWKTNGAAIPGATNSIFNLAAVPASWNGKLLSVVATGPGGSATSTNATIKVTIDLTPPVLLSALLASNSTSIILAFSEAMNAATATTLANYKITNAAGVVLPIQSATLSNLTNVVLGIASIPPNSYTVVVSGLKDASSQANFISSPSTATVGFQSPTITFDAVWRFYTNNVDLGTAWRAISFPDTVNNWSSGPGLISEEDPTTPPPEPILTPISRLDKGVYHYTFYFRYHFNAPVGTKTAVIDFRTIIDDGVIFYFNGVEFHRFNMAAGAVDWMTQANTNATEGIYNGPFTAIVSNVFAGDNVIAAEVHQNGTASSDVTFGAEMTITGQSTTTGGPGAIPNLQIVKTQGTNVVLSWPQSTSPFLLEKRSAIAPTSLWAPVTNQGPVTFVPKNSTNKAQFYRLRGGK